MDNQDTTRHARRDFLKGSIALAGPMPAWAQTKHSGSTAHAYVGSYTTEKRHGRGDGIHVFRIDTETGAWTHIQHVGNLVNPSFLIVSRDQRFLYSVHGDERYATSFAVDRESGHLTLLGQANTGGSNGVRQAIDASGKFMVVANYGSGTVAVLPVQQDGRLANFTQLVALEGQPGPHRIEQSSSHPHDIVFDPTGRFVLVPDKGLDRVFVFQFDHATGTLSPTEQGAVITRAGSGPRHGAFHPKLPVVWVLNELNSTTVTYRWDAGALHPIQVLPSLPCDFTGDNTGAEIIVSADGRYVYCSNRGHDSIVIYAADQKTGLLTSLGWVSTQGKTPRFIALDPSQRFLYAANEQGDSIVTFRVEHTTGRLTPTGHDVRSATPVAIAFSGGA
jgi:6-phosphogluconolactonase (cycloisomerase 2 family)